MAPGSGKGATLTAEIVSKLHQRQKFIRNICIVAHVDHGKTTVADTLVASNGIVSQKMAGKLRYMDSLEEEQLRGITMKSSAISIYYPHETDHYLINLIDSPGHVDFSSEVSTAVRLCDGAIVVIDAVEGVSPQTQAVLKQVMSENIKPVLLINKLDRLITELKMEPTEAYTHLQQILEQINAVMAQMISGKILGKIVIPETKTHNKSQIHSAADIEKSGPAIDDAELDNSNSYFSPELGNVTFGSAIDNWAFSIVDFAEIYSKKLGLNKNVLLKTLWGNYYFNNKTKKVHKDALNAGKKSLFVQLILDNIWRVYKTIITDSRDHESIEKLASALEVKISPRDLKNSDKKIILQTIMSQWLPMSKSLLGMVVSHIPSPLQLRDDRIQSLMCGSNIQNYEQMSEQAKLLQPHFRSCSPSEEAPVIVFVSKMYPVDKAMFSDPQKQVLTMAELEQRRKVARLRNQQRLAERQVDNNESIINISSLTCNEETSVSPSQLNNEAEVDSNEPGYRLIAFSRIFSGVIRKGQKLFVITPKSNIPDVLRTSCTTEEREDEQTELTAFTVTDLFVFMGRELMLVDEVPAGNIIGIGGLEKHVMRTATISNDKTCLTFSAMSNEAQPIIRVAIEPQNLVDMEKLLEGMKLLSQADSCVQVSVQQSGEYVLAAAGEVHLQKCCDDLRKKFANIKIKVSSPIVPYRETIVTPPTLDMVNETIGDDNTVLRINSQDETERVVKVTRGECSVTIEAQPLNLNITKLLDQHETLLQTIESYISRSLTPPESITTKLNQLKQNINNLYAAECEHAEFNNLSDRIWSFGPRKSGTNILLNSIPDYNRPSIFTLSESPELLSTLNSLDSSIINGFQLATQQGPLCMEPMRGVLFIIREWSLSDEVRDITDTISHVDIQSAKQTQNASAPDSTTQKIQPTAHTHNSGQVISIVKDACWQSFQSQPQRLMLAMYTCNIYATPTVLGKVYAVIGKRSGRVVTEIMQEGTQIFNITAVLPVAESFGFCEEMRKKTSGLASPQLAFSHWGTLEVDPYWEPQTEEELAHYGDKYDTENRAKRYMNEVRRRKGLKLHQKIVFSAEKQRNLGKNK